MLSIKGLASRLKLGTAQVAKDLTIKHRRKMFCKFDGTWYQFSANSEVIVPFKQARDYALTHSKKLPELVGVNDLNYDHLNGKDQEKVPVVVLLGHFNHGKTTLLDSLSGTSYVDEEKHSITQVRVSLLSSSSEENLTKHFVELATSRQSAPSLCLLPQQSASPSSIPLVGYM